MQILSILILLIVSISTLEAKDEQIYESQPNVIFEQKKLSRKEKAVALQLNFNTAVLYLEDKKYKKAIRLFKKTAKVLKIPSFLNIGIAYYKLGSINNSYLYLKKIYDLKILAKKNIYSYVSASYYLYLISKDRKYITTIIKVVDQANKKDLNDNVRRLLVDTYILLYEYKKAIDIIRTMKEKNNLKLAMLYLKTRNYESASLYLNKAFNETKDDDKMNQILWLQIYRDLKANNIVQIVDKIAIIQSRKKIFHAHTKMPISIFFNKDKYTTEQYFSKVNNFDMKRKIDMIFYFSPFIFIDKEEISNDLALGFLLKNGQNIESLDSMIKYNKEFIDIVKLDPIVRVQTLKGKISKKFDTKSYEYYNLGLAYAQIYDYILAHKYFKKAYNLNHANKLYSAMTLVSATRANIVLKKDFKKQVKYNLLSNKGKYKYLAKYIHKIVYAPKYKLNRLTLDNTTRKSIFFRALVFLEEIEKNGIDINQPLLSADSKDPLVFLLRSVAKQKNESKYEYISRLQDDLPKDYNDYFLKGPFIITQYYIDTLKGLGIFDSVDFNIKGETSPSYLRTKAIIQLFDGFPIQSITLLEQLQKDYNLNDKDSYFTLIASLLLANDISNASASLGMMQFELKDKNAKFLNGVQLLQSLKLNSAIQSFSNKYEGDLIDFKIDGFDELLESL